MAAGTVVDCGWSCRFDLKVPPCSWQPTHQLISNCRWLASLQEIGGQWAGRFNFVQSLLGLHGESDLTCVLFVIKTLTFEKCVSKNVIPLWLLGWDAQSLAQGTKKPTNTYQTCGVFAAPKGWRSQDVTESAPNRGEPQKSFWVRRWERASGLKALFSL